MGLTQFAVEKRVISYFAAFLLVAGGIASFFALGQLEDPDFSIKTAVVSTPYPGASPEEVELEVTDRIEKALQELPSIKNLYSVSSAGMSTVKVDIQDQYWFDVLPQVWDELRHKISDVTPTLPPGAEEPIIADDFGFVYGFVLAVTGDGYTPAELDDYVDALRKELATVPGVARVELWGTPDKVIYVDISEKQIAELGLTMEAITGTLTLQNMVVDAGHVDHQNLRFRIAPTGQFASPEEIGDLQIRATLRDVITSLPVGASAESLERTELIRIRDIGTVKRATLEPPRWEMRYNGLHAQAISLANVTGGNMVDTGRAIDERLVELKAALPIGIEVHKVAWQSDLVEKSISDFMINLIEAILIVLVVLTVPMGWRMGVIIGGALIFTILGTFMVMGIMGIDLHRMSLGALVIALGMMVDNAIVVSDGIFARLKQGTRRRAARLLPMKKTAYISGISIRATTPLSKQRSTILNRTAVRTALCPATQAEARQ